MDIAERQMPRCRIYWLDGRKFKTNVMVLFFDLPLERETTTKTALLAEVLKEGCTAYPTQRDLAKRSEELYGAVWDISIVKKGGRQLLVFSLEIPKIVDIADGLAFCHDILFDPLLEKGAFPKAVVERQKAALRKRLEGRKDDKRGYARWRCLEEVAKGTALGISADGYAEDIDQITEWMLYEQYRKIINEGTVKVFFCGEREEKHKVTPCRKWFSSLSSPSSCSGIGGIAGSGVQQQTSKLAFQEEPIFLKEPMDMAQSRLVMAFDADVSASDRNYPAFLLLNQLFGASPESALFQTIREEQGLCYEIKSYGVYPSGLLFVQMGIGNKDAKQAAKGVMEELDKMRNGEIPEDRFAQVKKAMADQYAILSDQPWGLTDFFIDQILAGKDHSLEWMSAKIDQLEVEEVARIAQRMKLKAVYLLGGKEA